MTPSLAAAPLDRTPAEDPGAEAQRILAVQRAAALRDGVPDLAATTCVPRQAAGADQEASPRLR
ncbi:MAG: hypothetical protein WDN69_18405 [Aliidongia sp.]